MKLYYKAGSCSLAPHIVLEESGLPYEAEAVDLKTKTTASGTDFWSINAKGYVPALQLDSGEVLTEGPAIGQYIADRVPGRNLAPVAGSIERYRLQGWLTYIGTELHKTFGPFFNPAAGQDWKDWARATLERRIAYVDQQLGAGGPFLLGEDFTVADAYLFTVLSWTRTIHFDLSPWPHVQAFRERVAQRPAVVAAMRAEGLIR